MNSETVLRDEPGEYRVAVRYSTDGSFIVTGESSCPLTLTVRVEDAWDRLPSDMRRYSYRAAVWRDDSSSPTDVLENVAPDARIFLDFKRNFRVEFK